MISFRKDPKKKKVLMFLNDFDTLGARTLKPCLDSLLKDEKVDVKVIVDGFGSNILDSFGVDYEVVNSPFRDNVIEHLKSADLLLSGKSYVNPTEYVLMEVSKIMSVPYAIVIPDIGGQIGIKKFTKTQKDGTLLLPDYILISDPKTHSSMIKSGIPAEKFVPIGHPYFDTLFNMALGAPEVTCNTTPMVTYFDVCFELDYNRGILPAGPYPQKAFIEDVIEAVNAISPKVDFRMKLHPQSNERDFVAARERRIPIIGNSDSFPLILESDIVISAYSTTLLEAALAGVPAISYQPWKTMIRGDVFDERVMIAGSVNQLKSCLLEAYDKFGQTREVRDGIVYNIGESLGKIMDFVYGVFDMERKQIVEKKLVEV